MLHRHSKWLSTNDLIKLTSGSSSELGLNSQVIQQVCKEYWTRRFHTKRRKLSWRKSKGTRRSLGWIPCTNQNVKIAGDRIKFGGKTFRFWKTREIPVDIRTISFNEDARGRWYINIVCLVDIHENPGSLEIGVDLGLKTMATLSDGRKFDRNNLTTQYAERLAMAQRAGKKKLARRIHAKIANIRKDWNHKTANAILAGARLVCVGDVSTVKLVKTRMAKSERYSQISSNLYTMSGFTYIGDTEPSYLWFKGNSILSRYQTQKHLLPNLLPDYFDENKSESEIMYSAGYSKVYDCGNYVFAKMI